MKAPQGFDIFTQQFHAGECSRHRTLNPVEVFEANTAGVTISTVSGTAIAGTRTSATRFTRSAGVWIDRVILPLTGITAAGAYTNFVVGETVTETGSGSTGVVESISTTVLVLKTISAAFTGAAVLTGTTSSVTATGGVVVTKLTDLKGKLIFSHASTVLTAGIWLIVKGNTASYLDVHGVLNATGTAVIICDNEEVAREAMDITYGT